MESVKLTSHKTDVHVDSDRIDVMATDQPGFGGAHHEYAIVLPNGPTTHISFQNGPTKEFGVNGVTVEVLLAICEHRLACFQGGPCQCLENGEALEAITFALRMLKQRTVNRVSRKVEGQNVA